MSYAEKMRREMAWSIRTMRLCMKWQDVTADQKRFLIEQAERHALQVLEGDQERGNATKRQATSGRKAIKQYRAFLETLPIKKEAE